MAKESKCMPDYKKCLLCTCLTDREYSAEAHPPSDKEEIGGYCIINEEQISVEADE